jgi:D-alanyl-D-alanine dipeptidase
MTQRHAVRRTVLGLRLPAIVVGGVAVLAIAAIVPAVGVPLASPSIVATRGAPGSPIGEASDVAAGELVRPDRRAALGLADGLVPEGVTILDAEYPAVAKLDPALLGAVRSAAADARSNGVVLVVDSGWRSEAYQEQLFREAVEEYGSASKASRWVARPGESAHEAGAAIDVGPASAAAWLQRHGASYGLCQIYRNEPWHFELRTDAVEHGCPPLYADASQDPRTQH